MPTQTKTDPIARLTELRQERKSAHQNGEQASATLAKLTAEIEQTRRDLEQAFEDRARGRKDHVIELEQARDQLRAEFARVGAEAEGASRAERKVVEQIDQHFAANFAVFAEIASRKSTEAEQAFEALRPAYVAAHAAWQTAVRAWDKPCRAIERDQAPGCPLAHPSDVFDSGTVPRPSQVKIDNGSEDA